MFSSHTRAYRQYCQPRGCAPAGSPQYLGRQTGSQPRGEPQSQHLLECRAGVCRSVGRALFGVRQVSAADLTCTNQAPPPGKTHTAINYPCRRQRKCRHCYHAVIIHCHCFPPSALASSPSPSTSCLIDLHIKSPCGIRSLQTCLMKA
jgi:hypothetical protein